MVYQMEILCGRFDCSLNAVKAICSRCPLAMDEDLLRDLVDYKNYKERSVMMAARSLIALYRMSNPDMLKKRDRVRVEILIHSLKILILHFFIL